MLDLLKKLTASRDAVTETERVLDALREATAEARDRLAEIEGAPVPAEEALTALSAWIDAKATSAVDGLSLEHLLQPHRAAQGIALPVLPPFGQNAVHDTRPAVDALFGLLLAANRETLLAVFEGQLRDLAQGRETIPTAERADRIEQARADLLAAELAEEAACRALERAGLVVHRRPDADPRALLADDSCLPT